MDKIVLAIETSCDETAVAVIKSNKQVLSHEILSQQEHKVYGGVFPEMASRAHMDNLEHLVKQAMKDIKFHDLDAVAATAGPGLIGGLIVGLMMAKGIANAADKPFIAINHLEAHALVVRLLHTVDFPFLLLIVSGGHCQFLVAQDVGKYTQLGTTLDDSLGETFDKVARVLGLQYPGGPIVESKALKGDGKKFNFPRALKKRPGCDFSFSGIKTSVRNLVHKIEINEENVCDICASFQECISDILIDRINNACSMLESLKIQNFVVTGGVAANNFLRSRIEECALQNNLNIFFPPNNLCTDNAVMVGWAGIERLQKNFINSLDFPPKAKWPLESLQNA
ncbi:tRNA (adenosine(37)-N6)-threonylcarbamoyltransferase complex transferase subunit TsaD [Candidatus Mesenet endosymbiont of Phosphuga atrata]|uniref:tRNA (adenosine(37)-N6)-threonylcarbamoyltransferase complex transferase subunit TsaD n=1 Tax=Candidatus Mesenet endosymbiont of Phosphuga atrata TaxID=3066221 RepID=UPI0030D4A0D0